MLAVPLLDLKCTKYIIFLFFIGFDMFKCDLWCTMIEHFLQHGVPLI